MEHGWKEMDRRPRSLLRSLQRNTNFPTPHTVFPVNHQQAIAASDIHPKAGQTLSGADTIVQVLADEGVDVVFGYSGGAILPTYNAIFRYNQERVGREDVRPMPLIVPANEIGRAHV